MGPTRLAQMMNKVDLDLLDGKVKFDSLCIYMEKILKCSAEFIKVKPIETMIN